MTVGIHNEQMRKNNEEWKQRLADKETLLRREMADSKHNYERYIALCERTLAENKHNYERNIALYERALDSDRLLINQKNEEIKRLRNMLNLPPYQ